MPYTLCQQLCSPHKLAGEVVYLKFLTLHSLAGISLTSGALILKNSCLFVKKL